MILVTTGTIKYPFPRLIKTIIQYCSENKSDVVIQNNDSSHPQDMPQDIPQQIKIYPMLKFSELNTYINKAETIVCSGGEGTMIQILSLAKKQPIIFPRLKKYKEHVDNQQLFIAQTLEKRGLAKIAVTKKKLIEALNQGSTLPKNTYKLNLQNRNNLVKQLSRC